MITLTTDFGLTDSYVAQMKGAIFSIHPAATIVDITHNITKFNIQTGAFILASAAPYFPKGTIHVAIIDPCVGTKRHALLITTKQGYFIGPDNGLLLLAAKQQDITSIHEITNPKYMLPKPSTTFHGRDIFAPAAAYIEKGVNICEFGPRIDDPIQPIFVQVKCENGSVKGSVLHVDSFGNIITNIRKNQLQNGILNISLQNACLELELKNTYGEVKLDDTVAFIGSHGFLEIAVNQGNAAEQYNVKVGAEIIIKT